MVFKAEGVSGDSRPLAGSKAWHCCLFYPSSFSFQGGKPNVGHVPPRKPDHQAPLQPQSTETVPFRGRRGADGADAGSAQRCLPGLMPSSPSEEAKSPSCQGNKPSLQTPHPRAFALQRLSLHKHPGPVLREGRSSSSGSSLRAKLPSRDREVDCALEGSQRHTSQSITCPFLTSFKQEPRGQNLAL